MNIAVVGLGYVGAVTAACFASAGHRVVGVDVSTVKVELIRSGRSPLSEFGLDDLVSDGVRSGRLSATTDLPEAVEAAEVVIVAVGTPSQPSGDVDMTFVESVVDELGTYLRDCETFKTIVITSTIPPGSLKGAILPRLERLSSRTAGVDFGLAFSPEFLREGTAIADFTQPEKVVIGADDEQSARLLTELFAPFGAPITHTTADVAEMVKFAANSWHALKVAFANEIGRICGGVNVDSHSVMEIFKQDKRLNISETYLTPGYAFGGSCLPKDLRTLTYRARTHGVQVPMLDSVLVSNTIHAQSAVSLVEDIPGSALILGLAFKAGTDDLRESPAVPLAEALLGKGRELRIFDEHVQLGRLVGANLSFVTQKLPHLAELLATDLSSELERADVIVIAQANPRFAAALGGLRKDQVVVDLTGVGRSAQTDARYIGLTW